MSSILNTWLNSEVRLSKDVVSFDEDFKTGYLLGELMSKFNHQPDFTQFVDSDTANAKINNFVRLQKTITKFGADFTSHTAHEIMRGNGVTVKKLLYQLKTSLDKIISKPAVSFHPSAGVIPACNMPDNIGKYVFEDSNSRFFEKSIRMLVDNQNNVNMEKLLQRFTDEAERQKNEASMALQREREEVQQARDAARIARNYQAEREAEFLKDWQHTGIDNWKKNQTIKKAREQHAIKVKEKLAATRSQRIEKNKTLEKTEILSEIDIFESKLSSKRSEDSLGRIKSKFGVTTESILEDLAGDFGSGRIELTQSSMQSAAISGSSNQTSSPTGAGEDSLEFTSRLESSLPHHSTLYTEAASTLRRITEQKAKSEKRRMDHARRRSNFINKDHDELVKEAKLITDDVIAQGITRACKGELEVAFTKDKIRVFKSVMRDNRKYREDQYESRRREDKVQDLSRNQTLYASTVVQNEKDIALSKLREEEIANSYKGTMRKYATNTCREIVDKMIDTLFCVRDYKVVTRNDSVPPFVLADYYALFESTHSMANYKEGEEYLDLAAFEKFKYNLDQWSASFAKKSAETYEKTKATATRVLGDLGVDTLVFDNDNSDAKTIKETSLVIGKVIQSIRDQIFPLELPPPPPNVPRYPITLAVFGKRFGGATTYATRLADHFKLTVLNPEKLLKDAIASTSREAMVKNRRRSSSSMMATSLLDSNEDVKFRASYHTSLHRPAHSVIALGREANSILAQGRCIPDDLYVRLIVAAICALPPHLGDGSAKDINGWVLDGFPSTRNQAAELEKGLSGRIHSSVEPDIPDGRTSSTLYPPPVEKRKPNDSIKSGLDVALLVHADDDSVLRRALGRRHNKQSSVEYHIDYNPPRNEELVSDKIQILPEELVLQASVGDALVTSKKELTEMQEWYAEFNTFMSVSNSDRDDERSNYLKVSSHVESLVAKFEARTAALKSFAFAHVSSLSNARADYLIDEKRKAAEKAKAEAKAAEEAALALKLAEEQAAAKGGKGKKEEPKKKDEAPAAIAAPPSAAAAEGTDSVKAVTEEPKGPNVLVGRPLPGELLNILDAQIKIGEQQYISSLIEKLHNIRSQHNTTAQHFADVEKAFEVFLARPDLKQDLVTKYQHSFNKVPQDMRVYDSTKGELALRTKELSDALWETCENRRNEAAEELKAVREDKWLEAYMERLCIEFISILQLEVDRYHCLAVSFRDYLLENKASLPKYDGEFSATAPQIAPLFSGKSIFEKLDEPVEADTKKAAPPAKKGAAAVAVVDEVAPNDVAKVISSAVKKAKDVAANCAALFQAFKSSAPDAYIDKPQFIEALEEEYTRTVDRLNVIGKVGVSRLQYLRSHALQSYTRMHIALTSRFQSEVSAVESLTAYSLTAVKKELPLNYLLRLQSIDFIIDENCPLVVAKNEVVVPQFEKVSSIWPTSTQCKALCEAIASIAGGSSSVPSAPICDVVLSLSEYGNVPSGWRLLTEEHVLILLSHFDALKEDLVDWRRLVLSLLRGAWGEIPSVKSLVALRNSFLSADVGGKGTITRKDYDNITLWFESSKSLPSEAVQNIRETLWTCWVPSNSNELHFWSLLMYLSADVKVNNSATLGLERAFTLLGKKDGSEKQSSIGEDELHVVFAPSNCGRDLKYLSAALSAIPKIKAKQKQKSNKRFTLASLLEVAPVIAAVDSYALKNVETIVQGILGK